MSRVRVPSLTPDISAVQVTLGALVVSALPPEALAPGGSAFSSRLGGFGSLMGGYPRASAAVLGRRDQRHDRDDVVSALLPGFGPDLGVPGELRRDGAGPFCLFVGTRGFVPPVGDPLLHFRPEPGDRDRRASTGDDPGDHGDQDG